MLHVFDSSSLNKTKSLYNIAAILAALWGFTQVQQYFELKANTS